MLFLPNHFACLWSYFLKKVWTISTQYYQHIREKCLGIKLIQAKMVSKLFQVKVINMQLQVIIARTQYLLTTEEVSYSLDLFFSMTKIFCL